MGHPDSLTDVGEDIINSEMASSDMSVEEIIRALAKRNCVDITSSIDLSACSEYPCAGGGFCDVYQGKKHDGARIAIKSLRVYDGPGAESQKRKILKRAARELYFWSRLRHRNVLPLIGLMIYRGRISMVSEWMENGNLMLYLVGHPDADRMCLCIDICSGLHYIHDNGMVHGDLKAANVVVSSKGVAMITDFGNAKLKDLTLKFSNTTSNSMSVRWTAPELLQGNGSEVSKEADVYAYGITALEVLSGETPYKDLNDIQVLHWVALKQGRPLRPDTNLDENLWDVLVSCWIQNPTERPKIAKISHSLGAMHPDCKSHPQGYRPRNAFEDSVRPRTQSSPDNRGELSDLPSTLKDPGQGNSPRRADEEVSTAGGLDKIAALEQELSRLRVQLDRANALNSLSGGRRVELEPPVFPTFQPNLKDHTGQNGSVSGLGASAGKRHQRRHSSEGSYNDAGVRDSVDERVIASKRSQANNPRTESSGLDGPPRFGNGLEIYDDHAEERIRLLSDLDMLGYDVHEELIPSLKIPSPTSTNAPSRKEVLFPANLISLISNEMWKYGMIRESERFLENTMQTIQAHVMSFTGEDAIVPGVFWLSNVHEILSFVCCAENDLFQATGPIGNTPGFDREAYEHLIQMVKSDLDSLEYNIYHSWMVETKERLSKMIIPALIETQSLPGFISSEGAGRLFNRLQNQDTTPAFSMDDVLNLLNKVLKGLKCFFMEESVIQQVVTELLKLVGVTSFNDLLMRRNFCSWKRAMQIQYNLTRIEEWCKSQNMPEGILQLEHLMQATKVLQLKKSTKADVDIIDDVCWILTPSQIQRMFANYFVADYENPISPEILKLVRQRVKPDDPKDHLTLPVDEDVAPYELPSPREVSGLEHYIPAYLNVPHIRQLAAISP